MVAIALSACVMVITHIWTESLPHVARSLLHSLPQIIFDNLCRYIGEEWNVNYLIHPSYGHGVAGIQCR